MKIKLHTLFLVILLITLTNCYNTERDCKGFKTGTFRFNYTIDDVKKTGKSVRTDSLNIDYYDNKIDSSSVRWINDCECVQKAISPKNKNEEIAIHFKVLTTKDSLYTFEYSPAAIDEGKIKKVIKGTVYKISD